MSDKKVEVSFEGTMTLDKALAYLEGLVASIRAGAVRIEKGEDLVVLTPGDVVKMEVEAKAKKGKQSLQLGLTWEDGGLRIGERLNP